MSSGESRAPFAAAGVEDGASVPRRHSPRENRVRACGECWRAGRCVSLSESEGDECVEFCGKAELYTIPPAINNFFRKKIPSLLSSHLPPLEPA